jgi:hypothetical protein
MKDLKSVSKTKLRATVNFLIAKKKIFMWLIRGQNIVSTRLGGSVDACDALQPRGSGFNPHS